MSSPQALSNSNNPWASYMVGPAPRAIPEGQSTYNDLPDRDNEPPSYYEATKTSSIQSLRTGQPANKYPDARHSSYGHPVQSQDSYGNHTASGASSQGVPRPILQPSASDDSTSLNDSLMNQALEFTHHNPPQFSNQRRLALPVAVPQVAAGLGMPLARAYSSVLQDRGISMEEFVQFIDNLNVVSTGSPPLQVLDLAGGIVGMVLHHIPQLVGNVVSLSAKLGSAGVSKGRSTMFLNKANSDFFAPRGLRVQLITGKALKITLGLYPDVDLASSLGESTGLNVQQRRVRALEGYISPLTFNVPPHSERTNALEKMSAWKVQRQLETSEKKSLKDREKALRTGSSSEGGSKAQRDFEKRMQKIEKDREHIHREYDKDLRKDGERKAQREFEKEIQKLDREVEKAQREFDKDSGKNRKDSSKDDKEVKQASKLLWLLVENS